MKRIVALLSVFALLLAIVAPMSFSVNTLAVNTSSHSLVWADGGGPAPPWPDIAASTNRLWADGGGPAPPWPDFAPSFNNLSA